MATTWSIADIEMRKGHALSVTLKETLDDGRTFTYTVTGGPNDTLATLRSMAKEIINAARVNRAKTDAIRAQFNSAQFEAYLNT